jgi:Ca2+-binding EF-hand superfamily protein
MTFVRRLPARFWAVPFAAISLITAGCSGSEKAAPAAAPQPTPPVVDDRRLLRFFGLMDQDQNGTISRPEFETGKGMVFMSIDNDDSQTLTQNEMRLTPEAFKTLAGADGVVDGQEFQNTKIASFEAMDADKNLEITYDELREYIAKYE